MLERNECSCKKCQLFCKVMPSYLLPEDMIPYMHATGFQPDSIDEDHEPGDYVSFELDDIMSWAVDTLWASDGAIVKLHDGNLMRVPTLVPKSRKNGSCIHYNQQEGTCAVHANAPFGCRFFSCSMDEMDATELSSASVSRLAYVWTTLLSDPDELNEIEAMYSAVWLELSRTGHKRKRSTIALRKKFAERLKEIENE